MAFLHSVILIKIQIKILLPLSILYWNSHTRYSRCCRCWVSTHRCLGLPSCRRTVNGRRII